VELSKPRLNGNDHSYKVKVLQGIAWAQPAGELDQVLLKRIEAKSVFDLENGELTVVRAVSLDQEFVAFAKEARAHAVIVECRIGEIAEDGLFGRVIHRMFVLRASLAPADPNISALVQDLRRQMK
jgi:hypothetical protein